MAHQRRLGEVSAVSVTYQPSCAVPTSLSEVRFRLQVWSCSRFLHPASYQAVLDSSESGSYMLYLRYKDLSALHKQLQWLFKALLLPTFPPKKWLIINSEAFLNRRAALLDQYFAELLDIGEVRRSQVLLEALAPPTQLTLKVLGQRGSGKGKFIRHLLKYVPCTSCLSTRTSSSFSTEGESTTPIDVIIDGKTVRIAAVEFVTVREGEACPWYLQSVKHQELALILKPFASSSDFFAETRCSRASDPNEQGKLAFETFCDLLRDFLKRAL